jgi:hypothetical protein
LPSTDIRSLKDDKCGEMYSPVITPDLLIASAILMDTLPYHISVILSSLETKAYTSGT